MQELWLSGPDHGGERGLMRAALLEVAETQMRSMGYSAFSYTDLAAQIGIGKACIHHHFPTKEAWARS